MKDDRIPDEPVFNPEAADADPRLRALVEDELQAVARDVAAQIGETGPLEPPLDLVRLDEFALGLAGRIFARRRPLLCEHCRVMIVAAVNEAEHAVLIVPCLARDGEEAAAIHALENLVRGIGEPKARIVVSPMLDFVGPGVLDPWAAVSRVAQGSISVRYARRRRDGLGLEGPWTDDGPAGVARAARTEPESLN